MNLSIIRSDDLQTCLALRKRVFIDEQDVPADLERDSYDASAIHLLAHIDENPVGTARIVLRDGSAKIGRICVLKAYRGRGIGGALTTMAVDIARDMGAHQARLAAQTHAIVFYEQLGFAAQGPVFMDAGIEHRDMVRTL